MSVNSKMTAIADKIRALLGRSGTMGLDAMASNLSTAVNECDTQAALIAQIKEALAEKAAGGGGGFVYPDGAFVPVTSFTDGKQYALVSLIGGVHRYINTTAYNNYTMNATVIAIEEDAGKYVIFGAEPALFTAVASGDGFLLQNGSNYLHGTTTSGTALRVGTTQAVWTVDTSETGGFSAGKYNPKEDANAVWLFNTSGGYDWSIKYETAGSFGYDRDGRDNTYSTGFTPFILYEYVAGESSGSGENGDSDTTLPTLTNPGTAADMAEGKQLIDGNGNVVTGTVVVAQSDSTVGGTSDNVVSSSVIKSYFIPSKDCLLRGGGRYLTTTVYSDELGDAAPEEVLKGKIFSSESGINMVGTYEPPTGGSVIKSGTTTSGTINTGLSDIEQFFLYKESQTATGLIHLHYTKSATSRMYASAWSTQNYGTKTITNGTGGVTANGGTITISATQAAQGALSSGVTYKWIAVGAE